MCVCVYVCVCVCVCVCVWVNHCQCITYLTIDIILFIVIYLSMLVCSYLSISIYLSIHLSMSVSIYLSIYFSLSISIYLSIMSICLYLSHYSFSRISSSSSLCRAISTDIPDPLSPPFPIVHYFQQVFKATSRIGTELLYVG